MPLRVLVLNSGPFPRPVLPGVGGTTGLSATPGGPACPSRASGRRSRASTARGFPCCVGSPLQTCRRHYPGGTTGSRRFAGEYPPIPPVTAAFPDFVAGRLPHYAFRGLLGVHSRYGLPARGVARTTLCIGGSGGFVTSTAAPIATGWSDESCRAGFAPAEDPRLITAHTKLYAKPRIYRRKLAPIFNLCEHKRPTIGVPSVSSPGPSQVDTQSRLPNDRPRLSVRFCPFRGVTPVSSEASSGGAARGRDQRDPNRERATKPVPGLRWSIPVQQRVYDLLRWGAT